MENETQNKPVMRMTPDSAILLRVESARDSLEGVNAALIEKLKSGNASNQYEIQEVRRSIGKLSAIIALSRTIMHSISRVEEIRAKEVDKIEQK